MATNGCKYICLSILAGCLIWRCSAAAPIAAPTKGAVVFQADFERADSLAAWSGGAVRADGFQGGSSVLVQSKTVQSATMSIRLPVEAIRGCSLKGTGMVKAEEVGAKPNPWNGIKFMLAIESPSGKTWPQAALETGSFDWRQTKFTVRIPADATAATLVLGLEAVAGKAWFDDIKFVVAKTPPQIAKQPAAGPVFKGHPLPRLRGAMVSPNARPQDLIDLGKNWNANLIRWQLIRTGANKDANTVAAYDRWIEGELEKLDALLPVCETNGLMVVVDLHSPPGGRGTAGGYSGTDGGLFTDRSCQEHFIDLWRRIAQRYKTAKAIWGYDLANEPVEEDVAEDCLDWHDLAERAGKAIRQIDPERALIVEAPPWGGPSSLADFTPIGVSNVVYSFHMYEPMAFTHQGVFKPISQPVEYPGVIDGKKWDAAALEAALKPVIEFQKNYQVHIYAGEFSAIRWAPGQSVRRYLSDLIGIFEKHGWDWSYHAFREWQGWSAEHGGDKADTRPASQPTDRQLLLQEWFAKNAKPRAGGSR